MARVKSENNSEIINFRDTIVIQLLLQTVVVASDSKFIYNNKENMKVISEAIEWITTDG